jgi:hypothetical protein
VKARRSGLSLAVVRDLRVARRPVTEDEVAAFEIDVLAGFVLARAAAGLSDGTIASDVMHLERPFAGEGARVSIGSPEDSDAFLAVAEAYPTSGARACPVDLLRFVGGL